MVSPIRLESVSEAEAACLIGKLDSYVASVERRGELYDVEIAADGDNDRALTDVIQKALDCFADGDVRGFVLVADNYRLPIGLDDESGPYLSG